MHDIDELLKLATELATSAGEILQTGRREGFGQVLTKSSDVDIVTEIDHASEQHLVSILRERRPDDGILGEEGTSVESRNGVRWVIDPLDGTVNFTYGIPQYAVSIGVEIDDEPVVGVVLNPALDELFTASRGGGAFLNDQAIHVGGEADLAMSLVATGFAYGSDDRAAQAVVVARILPLVRDIRRAGSAALDICSVACGRVDAYYEHGVKPWDVTGANVVAVEAGAVMTSFENDRSRTSAVVANPRLHEQLLTLITD